MKTDIAKILLLSLVVFSCTENPNSNAGAIRHELDGTRWWPVDLHGECVLNRIYEKFPILSFRQDSLGMEMYVQGGGNSAGRGILFKGDSILTDFKNLGIPPGLCRCVRTKECIDQQMERLLYETSAYQIEGDTLYIFGKQKDQRIGTFVRYGDNDYIATDCGG